ncbi:DUF3892 domain-containing protein [Xanthomonas vesicatoria]|uniref:DUF3892 domain-containing protein n=2 Tax=Xanthomonas TaxID=338 RepID=UPI000731EF30|nr:MULTISPECIES: DUF3892 domain-containing protein [Xanthomonas]KTF31463.1 hypothetical protein LMG919_19535 [Xanthomonas vesicatoria]MBV6791763.1 DUF3892 domain-containing protein [Xanthomonas campestris pv. clerodendri]MCC8559252.1 DUF3892 domain-containing protein [Xanthomonas vesicatoria]MCC8601125.1 DUF3892 domain-containing protein [Xanthomonas vesicatoria]MCC8608344.1 DUF3892 domain-containing protein [Xanthomonas vesicatoria]
MAKWADYGISAVRYNAAHTHINRVRAHPDNGDTIGAAAEYERAAIVKAIKDGNSFITIVSSGGNWQKGQPVYIIKVNGVEYIKTVDNGKEQDNLENLPEF